jgi:hypothetical protein
VRYALVIGMPVLAAAAWGTFAVLNDPSRSGNAPVPVPGYVRLLLELAALGGLGARGWTWSDGWVRYALVIGMPVLAAAAWGTFAVLNDPSRSGSAPVPVPGYVRLLLELTILGLGAWALGAAWRPAAAYVMGAAVVLHYVLYWERIVWLLRV